MRLALSIALRLGTAGLLALLVGAAPASARVVVVGVDGGSWNVLDPMMAGGELPHLASLAARGVTADLDTVEPVISPVVWTSIATGRSPDAHGVHDFFATRLAVRVPSAYERLAAAGLRVGLYDVLVTWPPPGLPGGFVIPGWLRRDDAVTPPDVWQRIPLGPFVNRYDRARTNRDYLHLARQEVDRKPSRWNALARAFDLDVGAVTFYALDMTAHRFWHGAFPGAFDPPVPRPAAADEATAVRDAVRGIDRSLGEIAAQLEPEDTVIVVSDHGFAAAEDGGRTVWVTDPTAVCAAAGLVPERDGFTAVGGFGAVTFRVAPGELAARDAVVERLVAALRAFRTEDGRPLYGRVEFLDGAPRPPGHERPLLTRLRQWGVRKAVEWAFGVRVDSTAHAVVFGLPDDAVLSEVPAQRPVRTGAGALPRGELLTSQRFTGRHDPIGILLAAGGPIASRSERLRLSVLDVAPLLFWLSDQPLPDDLEGRLPVEALGAEALAARPPRRIPAARAPRLAPAGEAAPIEDPDLVEKLRSLGYLD